MSSWSKTLHGEGVSIVRAFRPIQNALVRLGYELVSVREEKHLKFRRRAESAMAWDNHRRAHNVELSFKERTRGVFTKERYLEVVVTFDDWDMMVSDGAASAWQEVADKLQVMLSDPAVFLPLAPPLPITPHIYHAIENTASPREDPPAAGGPSGLGLGAIVSFSWMDSDVYRGKIVKLAARSAEILLDSGRTTQVDLSELTLLSPGTSAPVPPERERIVERQVVVMHCKYCGKLTPVDLSDCRECGGRL